MFMYVVVVKTRLEIFMYVVIVETMLKYIGTW